MSKVEIPRIMIAAPASGSGKTVITCGLLKLLSGRGLCCVSFKVGPDYIDPLFHQYVLGVPSYNLDSFFLERENLLDLACRASEGKQIAVMEGVMGFYDGIGGISTRASSYEVAALTETPVILVLDGKKCSLSSAAVLKGFLEYRGDHHVCGVLLNRTSPAMGERLRPFFEEQGVSYLGAVPELKEAAFESRHLGLTLPKETRELQEKLALFADRLEQYLDLDAVLRIAGQAGPYPYSGLPAKKPGGRLEGTRIAVARDEAFCFYYQENLTLLEEAGCCLVYFSPLRDLCLPDQLDGVILGGGYPEAYARELSENEGMRSSVFQAAERGVPILAECGGFLYLHRSLEDLEGQTYPMAAVISADAYRTDKLSRFGYISLSKGSETVKAHEFHYWESTDPGSAMRAAKPLSDRGWDCMHVSRTMIAGFPHLYYRSNPEFLFRFLKGEGEPCSC